MDTNRPSSRRNQCSGSSGAVILERRDLEDLDAREHRDLLGDLGRLRERLGLSLFCRARASR